jgi:hypothetical protein
MDANEQRVLARYEQDAYSLQAQQARSLLDKVQQKRLYVSALRQNYRLHGIGKRTGISGLFSGDEAYGGNEYKPDNSFMELVLAQEAAAAKAESHNEAKSNETS